MFSLFSFCFFFRLIWYKEAFVVFESTNCTRPTGSWHFVILKNLRVLIAYVFHADQRPGNGQGKTFLKKWRKVKKLYFVREIVRLWEMSWKSEIPSERNSFSLSWPVLYERWQRLTFCDVNVTREYCSVYLIDPSKHTVSLVMQARVGLGMKLFTYLFLFSQFSNIQNVFGTIHPTWNILVW